MKAAKLPCVQRREPRQDVAAGVSPQYRGAPLPDKPRSGDRRVLLLPFHGWCDAYRAWGVKGEG